MNRTDGKGRQRQALGPAHAPDPGLHRGLEVHAGGPGRHREGVAGGPLEAGVVVAREQDEVVRVEGRPPGVLAGLQEPVVQQDSTGGMSS